MRHVTRRVLHLSYSACAAHPRNFKQIPELHPNLERYTPVMSAPAAGSAHLTEAVPNRSSLLRRHMPGLDILRGIAIHVVVLYHGLYWGPLVVPPPHTVWSRLASILVFGR